MTASCSCSPGACHGGHTIDVGPVTTRLTATQAWMLAHDWTEMSEGDSGWMWQHTTGRKVAVFRDLTDPHAWEGLIGRLAVAHARHPGDIEREIRGDEPPVPHLTDEHLRRIAQYVHPDEATDYVRPWLHSMAAELLALRARVAELEAANTRVQEFYERARHERDESRARVVELEAEHGLADRVTAALDRIDADRALEAAQRAPVGYAVVTNYLDARWVQAAPVVSLEAAQARARVYGEHEARVVELREVAE